MAFIKKFKEKASNALRRLEPAKYTIAAPFAVTGAYVALTALTSVDYSSNAAAGLTTFSIVGGGVYDATRFYKYRS